MAYNYNYQTPYLPAYAPQAYPQAQIAPQMPQGNNSSRIWVQGESGAKSYLVGAGHSVDLWDSEQPVIYVKSADATGMPTMRIIDYSFRESDQPKTPAEPEMPDYATKADIEALFEKIDELKAKMEPQKAARKKVTEDDE